MRDGTRTRARQRHYNRLLLYVYSHLYSFTCRGHGATTFIQINEEKTTLKDKGVRLDLLGLYGVGLGGPKESHETVAGYLHHQGASMGRPATPCPHGS